jgi:hypothetical protein
VPRRKRCWIDIQQRFLFVPSQFLIRFFAFLKLIPHTFSLRFSGWISASRMLAKRLPRVARVR